MNQFLFTCVLLLVSGGCFAEEVEFPIPEQFSIGIEGFAGASYRVSIDESGKGIVYQHNPRTFTAWEGTKTEKIEIPNWKWRRLWYDLGKLKVWEWKKEYIDPDIADGTVWDVTIVWDGKEIRSRGNNAYPSEKEFLILRLLIESLIEGRNFR